MSCLRPLISQCPLHRLVESYQSFKNSEIFHANSEKSKYLFYVFIQLFHVCLFDSIVTEASKDWLILERITEVASTTRSAGQ